MFPMISSIWSLFFILQIATVVHANEDRGQLQPEIWDKRVSLKAENMPLGVLLEKLSKAQDITFILKDTVNKKLSLELIDVQLEEALNRILRNNNFAILYDDHGIPSVVYIIGNQARIRVSPPQEPRRAQIENNLSGGNGSVG
jgi:type II secretory pathway component HofQ